MDLRKNKIFPILKRAFDFITASFCLFILFPFMLSIAVLIHIKIGRPIFFKQQRPGLNGKPFCIYKFRTMTTERDKKGNILPDEKRLLPFGKFLRETSIDELPELFNVLLGQMSMVGPRPLLMQYLVRYTPKQARRHEVRPGVTGWAQIKGRNSISWEEKFDLDVWYVDNHDFKLDLRILILTFWYVIRRKNINAANCVTMHEFNG